jgi:hypothetical protein
MLEEVIMTGAFINASSPCIVVLQFTDDNPDWTFQNIIVVKIPNDNTIYLLADEGDGILVVGVVVDRDGSTGR